MKLQVSQLEARWSRLPKVRGGWEWHWRQGRRRGWAARWEVAHARGRSLPDLVASFEGTGAHVRRLQSRGWPAQIDYTWIHDLRVARDWRGLGLARQILARIQERHPGVLVLTLGAATGTRMAMEERRRVYRRLGFMIWRVAGQEVGLRPPPGVDGRRQWRKMSARKQCGPA